jgi:tetratricopeptide (TPR) repeat protein
LAADLDRLLKNHPVTARPASALYQFSRFARRNRTSFVLTCLLFAAVTTAASVSWWQALRIADERDRASREAEKFRRINDVLTGFLRAANVWEEGSRDAKVIDVLDGLARQIESEVESEPLVAAALRHTLGQTYRAFSRYEDAARHLRYALDVRGRMLGAGAEEVLATKAELGEVLYESGALDEAEPLLEQVLAARQSGASGTVDEPQLAQSLNSIGLVRARRGDSHRAESAIMQALTMRYAILRRLEHDPKAARREQADAGNAVAQTLNNLAGLHRARSRSASTPDVAREQLDRALPLYREALALRKTWLGPQHPETAKMHNNLAKCLQDHGELDAAFEHFDQALRILMKEPGEMHRFTGLTLRNLAELERQRGRHEAGAEYARRSATILEKVLGTSHPDTQRATELARELSDSR